MQTVLLATCSAEVCFVLVNVRCFQAASNVDLIRINTVKLFVNLTKIEDIVCFFLTKTKFWIFSASDFRSIKYIYTGCHRRNGPNFGRVFLMLNYTDITQNTYIQS